MLKTRAYLCQTVTEMTPMSRLVSNFVGQARQALEGLLRRGDLPKVPQGIVTRSEAPALAIRRRGLLAGIDRGSRSFIRQFLAKNRPADLATAMRNRHSARGEFRRLGQTFGFVGVGVVAGSQWGGSDVDGDFHFEPFFKTVQEMFGGSKAKVDDSVAKLTDFQRRLDDFTQIETSLYSELSFVQIDDLSISPVELSSRDMVNDISMLDEAVIEVINQKPDDDHEATESIVKLSSNIESLQGELSAELLAVQTTVDAQRKEINDLQIILSQLSMVLYELTGSSSSLNDDLLEDFVVLENEDVENDLNDDEEGMLRRAWSLVTYQRRQLDILHRTVCDQNEQLSSLLNLAPSGHGIVVTRSAHCKRDACCGPGCAG